MANPFWHLAQLSDVQLLERLQSVLHTKRRALAELIAHLGEVEERWLHLQAACSSLFSYCVHRLGMSEDEACRRIEVARLARKYPVLFAEIEGGRITLSAALLLKRVLSPENHLELIAPLRGASTERARELLARAFRAPTCRRAFAKLPERRSAASQPANAASPAATPPAVGHGQCRCAGEAVRTFVANLTSCATDASKPYSSKPCTRALQRAALQRVALQRARSNELPSREAAPNPPPSRTTRQPERSGFGLQQRIEPLSAGRYRVQFTADASLKRKLEQARDLLRHAQPDGDLVAIGCGRRTSCWMR